MKSRLLTATAIAVLTVLWAAGTGMAAPFTHGYANIAAGGDGALNNTIYHCQLVIPSTNVPFTLVGVGLRCSHSDETSPATDPVCKAAFYSVDGTTVLDSTEEISTRVIANADYPMNFTSHYQITDAGTYNIAIWGNLVGADAMELEIDTTTYDTTWVMTSQAYGGAWPTLSDANAQVNKHLVAGIIGIKGDAGIVGTLQTEDTRLHDGGLGADNYNYGGSITHDLDTANNASDYVAMRCLNVDANLGTGKTVDACSLWFYTTGVTSAEPVRAYELLQNWEEGTQNGAACSGAGATWLEYQCVADNTWGVEGAQSLGTDIAATHESEITISAATTWYGIPVTAALVQAWYNGTKTENGVLLRNEPGNPGLDATITASEGTSNWPVWQFYTSAAAEPGGTPLRRRRLLSGGN